MHIIKSKEIRTVTRKEQDVLLSNNNSINPFKGRFNDAFFKNRWHVFSPLVSLMSVKSFRMCWSSWSIIRNIKVNDAQHNSLCQHSHVHNYSTDWHLNQFGTYHTIWYVSNPSAASNYIRLLPVMPMYIRTVLAHADEISFGFGWCQRAVALLEWHPSLLYTVMDSDVTWNCLSWNLNLHKQTIEIGSVWPRSSRLPWSRENSPTAISLCVPSCLLFFPLTLSSLLLSFNGPLTYKC